MYQAQLQSEFYRNGAEFVAMAIADNPKGPFIKTGKKLVDRTPDGKWFRTDGDNYNSKEFKRPNHDPSLNSKVWFLFYLERINPLSPNSLYDATHLLISLVDAIACFFDK